MTLASVIRKSSRRAVECAGLVLIACAGLSGMASAQQAGSRSEAPTKVIPAIRSHIYERLNEAQICMDEDDLVCAVEELNQLERVRDLNNYEIAQMWNFRAFIFFEQDNVDGAIDAYERMLALPHEDMPDGMIQSTTRNLAALYVQEEQYEEALATFTDYLELPTVTPSSDDYYMLASIHYSMDDFEAAISPLQMAIQIANDAGNIGDEAWYQLLYVCYFELEQTDNVIDTLTFMVENWTKRDWIIALAGQLSNAERENETLTLYEAAYDAGFLTRGTELVQLANLYLNAQAPFKAATLLQDGLDSGTIESTESNWRTLAQAWQLAAEHERALPAFEQASALADDGDVDRLRAQSLARLARWEECVEAAQSALDRGGLDRTDYTYLQLGQCYVNMRQFEEARTAFQGAARDERSEADARRWITFVNGEIERERLNREALASLEN